MALQFHHLACLLLVATSTANNQRWSRQISSYTADISDWVPLSGPVEKEPTPPKAPQIKRQAVAEPRILAEPSYTAFRPDSFPQEAFPSRNFYTAPSNNKLYLQTLPAVPSAPQNYLTDNGFGQGIRFGLSQPNFPLNQGFVAPQYTFDNLPTLKLRPQVQQGPANPVKFESYPKIHTNLPSPQAKPFINQQIQAVKKPEVPKFVDGYRTDNLTNNFRMSVKKKPQIISKIKFEDKFPKTSEEIFTSVSKPKSEREEVQLLYVPVESLNRGSFNFRPPVNAQQFVNNEQSYIQNIPKPQLQDFSSDFQRSKPSPAKEHFGSGQDYYANFNNQQNSFDQSKFSTIATPFPTQSPTTPKPKKLKPHQPPLAIFVTDEAKKGNELRVGDVLSFLKSSTTVAVLDSVSPQNAPKVFIGPNSLIPPQNYVKFELPYLSNLEHSDKKLRQLPFFVAPLSYNTPQGFAKIPFPSPHVGSVVINAQIRDNNQQQAKQLNNPSSFSYSPVQKLKQELTPVTQKPTFTYYTTSSPKSIQPNYDPNYYSFEPQSVSTVRPPKEETNIITAPPKTGTYFLNELHQNYDQAQYGNYPESERSGEVETMKSQTQGSTPSTTTRTPSTTTSTTTAPSTYPSRLLETHNPYSINQAFHLSTPLDYHKYYDEYKEGYPGYKNPTLSTPAPPSSPSSKPVEVVTEKQNNQQKTSPAYLQNYSPEVHYESEVPNSRFPSYNTNNYNSNINQEVSSQLNEPTRGSNKYSQIINEENEYTQQGISVTKYSQPATNNDYNQQVSGETEYSQPQRPAENTQQTNINDYVQQTVENSYTPSTNSNDNNQQVSSQSPTEYNRNVASSGSHENFTETVNYVPTAPSDLELPPTKPNYYNQYETDFSPEVKETTPTSTTTTRRTPLRTRGRPRYTTPKPDSTESTTRTVVTRRPLRERKPLPARSRYEPNNITSEKPTRKTTDSSEITTKSNLSRSRTRGRVHYKPKESDTIYNKRQKSSSKENDLAYQRDILHQNYPVTLSERLTTQNADPVTEPLPRISSTRNIEPVTEAYDSENAFTNEKISVSQQSIRTSSKEDSSSFPSRTEIRTERPSIPKLTTRREDYTYQSRSSFAPIDAISAFDELTSGNDEDIAVRQTTPLPKSEEPETATVPTYSYSENDEIKYPTSVAYSEKHEELMTVADIETTKFVSQEVSTESEPEFNVVQTTPSFSRVRVRPGVVRQHHPASSTESSRPRIDRKRPVQAVTYRPAYSGRRTTMRIEEIEADLKTKQVHTRTEQDYKHPVYKPEPTTANSVTTSNLRETTTKQGHFRRRRPNYTTSSTEASSSKRTYEVNSRFRGRRPTTEKPEVQTDAATSTTRTIQYSRYSNRPRLSERFNKKPEPEETEDQDSNYSINRPKYVSLETDQWSPKLSSESFKPYNPNDIVEENKSTTERRSDFIQETDIITARNELEDVLISVTPATNNKTPKKLPEIPPTLEALVETTKHQNTDTTSAMTKFETMLEEVMKSLEEQDENEYTTNVMKHKGGEIGEIPPEDVAPTNDSLKPTIVLQKDQEETTTAAPEVDEISPVHEEEETKGRRRGFWKKVKVRPVTEAIEVAESQYYTNTVNRLGQPVITDKNLHDKPYKNTAKIVVTTYKPAFHFLADIFESDSELSDSEIKEIKEAEPEILKQTSVQAEETTEHNVKTASAPPNHPGDVDMGTGSPDPSVPENIYYNTPAETTTNNAETASIDRSDGFNFMDYLFGSTSPETEEHKVENSTLAEPKQVLKDIVIPTEVSNSKLSTTESTYIPDEITAETRTETSTESFDFGDNANKKTKDTTLVETTEKSVEKSVVRVESATESSFMDPSNVVSTSMSTEVSHETEICFRGKCIKTKKDLL